MPEINPYDAPNVAAELIGDNGFRSADWWIHSWTFNGTPVRILHREPFRLTWVATQLVTYVFIINRRPENYESIDADYEAMRAFASQHKRTWLPFAFQCGYALLPIYVGESFNDLLVRHVENRFKKRWCVFHVPSLLDSSTGHVHTLHRKSFWGCIYRDYIRTTVIQVASAVQTGELAE